MQFIASRSFAEDALKSRTERRIHNCTYPLSKRARLANSLL
jgi:hypothetical protein